MKKAAIAILATGLIPVCLASPAAKKTWNFDKDRTGVIAVGFSNEVGDWQVTPDPTAPSASNVLAQTARNSGNTFNITLVQGTSYKDVDLSVKMKAVAGDEDEGGGLIWRAKDKKNYYIARFNPLEDNFRLYKVDNGRRIQFEDSKAKGDKNWHTLRVTMQGDHIQCYLDGKKQMDHHDSTFKDAGMIGLWSKADAQSHFDDLAVATP
jgi:hypothetical protein